jgi:hypothetical protein
MKQILSLFMFGIGALLFLAFLATLKPNDVTAASGSSESGQCSTKAPPKLACLYREEKLTVRRRGGRKRAIGTRAPMLVPMTPNDRRQCRGQLPRHFGAPVLERTRPRAWPMPPFSRPLLSRPARSTRPPVRRG